jgi:hypothetical protein
MEKIEVFFKELYEKFNQRKISDVVFRMTDNDLPADETVYHYFQLENVFNATILKLSLC